MDPTAVDFSGFPWLAFALAVVANMVIGFVWYAQWFPTGKIWIRETKMDVNQKIPGSEMAKSMIIMVVGALLMMFVYVHNNWVYEEAFRVRGTTVVSYDLTMMDTLTGAVFTWLGFIVPLNLNDVAFNKKSWSLFWVNSGYYLVSFLVAAMLVAVL